MRELIESVRLVQLSEQFLYTLDESLAEHTRIVGHLSHAEDLGHEHGHAGTEHSVSALKAAASHIEHGTHNANLSTKVDGGVSIVAGHHPHSGKPFVGYKGAIGKIGTEHETKLCYSHADCDKHFGDKPYLVDKMKTALDHAHKVLPKHGIYQGDMLFDKSGKKDEGHHVSFTPNTITYAAKKNSAEGEKIKKAQLGISFHTGYKQREDGSLQSHPVDHDEMKHHDDVYHLSTSNDTGKAHFSEQEKAKFHTHIGEAEKLHKAGGNEMYKHIEPVKDHIGTYINKTIRTGDKPSLEGLKQHISEHGEKEASKVKTEKSKTAKIGKSAELNTHIDAAHEHVSNYFKMHHHLQQAKDTLVKTLDNADHPLEHTIDGKKTAPEGYVFSHQGAPVKLVNRKEFSRANLNREFNK